MFALCLIVFGAGTLMNMMALGIYLSELGL